MRCDDTPDGCASCRQAQTDCKTTDRITGKAAVRGYVDSLEARLAELERRNQELQTQVISLGGPVKQDSWNANSSKPSSHLHKGTLHCELPKSTSLPNYTSSRGAFEESPNMSATHNRAAPTQISRRRNGFWGNNYLGISTGDNFLSSVRGTSMNILGMEIDLTDYLNPDLDEPNASSTERPAYNKSYMAFVHSAFGLGSRLKGVELPARHEGMEYADIFLRITVPFVPVVHAPSFLDLVSKPFQSLEKDALLTSSSLNVLIKTVRRSRPMPNLFCYILQWPSRIGTRPSEMRAINRTRTIFTRRLTLIFILLSAYFPI